jgi:hypothetical protein
MRKALMIVGAATVLVVALSIDICVLLGTLPISAAAGVSIVAAIIVTVTKPSDPKTAPGRGFALKNAATSSHAAENGEAYVITGKSIHNNPGELERPDR